MKQTLNFKAAIFDMDGLLLDTERVCMQAFEKACQTLSIPMRKQVYLSIIGCNKAGIEAILTAGYQDIIDYPTLRDTWTGFYHPIVETQAIPLKQGVIELLDWLKENQIPIAVATSTPKELATKKLNLAGIFHYFDSMSNGCEVSKGKPDPEIFLLAAKRLGFETKDCLAFEDSNNGVISAVSAGTQTFQIPDLAKPTKDVIKLNHTICDSLTEALALISQGS
jgi:HAD superfamily hydrolase (TIGR01509 family)